MVGLSCALSRTKEPHLDISRRLDLDQSRLRNLYLYNIMAALSASETIDTQPESDSKDHERSRSVVDLNGDREVNVYHWYWPTDCRQVPVFLVRDGDADETKFISTEQVQWSLEWSWFRIDQTNEHFFLETFLKLLSGARAATISYRLIVRDRYGVDVNPTNTYDAAVGKVTVLNGHPEVRMLKDVHIPPDKQGDIAIDVFMDVFKIVPFIRTPHCSLARDIQAVIEENEDLKDVSLLVGPEGSREEIRANKLMLMARSPVFARMFQSNMVEKNTNTIEIVDIDPDVFKVVLAYVYTGKIKEEVIGCLYHIKQVLVAADKYEMKRLAALCENLLVNHLTEENAASLLAFASKYCDDAMKQVVISYIVSDNDRCRMVLESEGWEEVKQEGVELVEEVFRYHVGMSELPPAKRRRSSF